ncbi:MAG: toprim domain-containing protein [Bacteroidetes bacterium]|nr:toprim domain-containing protein [Bacteroidota bacterium]
MTRFDELKERYPNLIPVQELRSNVSIVELAIQYGYEPLLRKGRSRPVLEHKGYDDVIIIKNPHDAAQQLYQRAGNFTDSGTIIDFIRNRLSTVFSTFNRPGEHEFRNITSVLYDYLNIDPTKVAKNRKVVTELAEAGVKQPFTKEQFDIRPLEKDNYLNQRHIAPETLQRPEFINKVVTQISYLDPDTGSSVDYLTVRENTDRKYVQFSNVAFPYYNGQSTEVMGLELRNNKVKLHATGSDRTSSVFVSNPPAKVQNFYVMESAIDAISHRQLQSIHGDQAFDSVYFSTGGYLTSQQVNTITRYIGSFEKTDDWRIRLGFDSDPKGHKYDLQFIQQLVAVKFPMSPAVSESNRVAYLLPEEEAYRSIRNAVLDRVELYNKGVQAQFVRMEGDTLGQKELNSQLITVSRAGQQVQLSIPEASAPLSAVGNLLLEATALDQRIRIEKSCAKDFNLDLAQEVKLGEKFRYAIMDESGRVLINGNSPSLMARSIQQVRRQAEHEGTSGFFTLIERQPFGFQKAQVEIKIEQGVVSKAIQTPEFDVKIKEDKRQRSLSQAAGGDRGEKQALNPESKPAVGAKPNQNLKPRQ